MMVMILMMMMMMMTHTEAAVHRRNKEERIKRYVTPIVRAGVLHLLVLKV